MATLIWLVRRLFDTAATPAEPVLPRHEISDNMLVSRSKICGKTGGIVFLTDSGEPVSHLCRADIANA